MRQLSSSPQVWADFESAGSGTYYNTGTRALPDTYRMAPNIRETIFS